MNPDFNVYAACSALCKFAAEGDEANAWALVDGLQPDERRALAQGCDGLLEACADQLKADVRRAVEDWYADDEDFGSLAIAVAIITARIEDLRRRPRRLGRVSRPASHSFETLIAAAFLVPPPEDEDQP